MGNGSTKAELDAACTSVQVANLKNISQLKITWNKDNIPVLYEIMPIENPFIEENKADYKSHRQAGQAVIACKYRKPFLATVPEVIRTVQENHSLSHRG